MKWFLSISFLFLYQLYIGQAIQQLEDSLISILKQVQTEKNTQLVDIHNNNFKATLDIVIKHPESFEYGFDSPTASPTTAELCRQGADNFCEFNQLWHLDKGFNRRCDTQNSGLCACRDPNDK